MTVCQKVPKSYFESRFLMSKINVFFFILRDHFLLKWYFVTKTVLTYVEKKIDLVIEKNWKKLLGFRNMQEKLGNVFASK